MEGISFSTLYAEDAISYGKREGALMLSQQQQSNSYLENPMKRAN